MRALHLRHQVALLLATLLGTHRLSAQLVAGQAVDAESLRPLHQFPVYLERLAGDRATAVREVFTDAQGFFQILVPTAGVYRLAFGDSLRPISLGPVDTVANEGPAARRFAVPFSRHVFLEKEVDWAVQPLPGQGNPRYPEKLREARIAGSVRMRFVVDTLGRVDPGTVEVMFTTAPEFGSAVRDHVKGLRFVPAKWRDRLVNQEVVQPFGFDILR